MIYAARYDTDNREFIYELMRPAPEGKGLCGKYPKRRIFRIGLKNILKKENEKMKKFRNLFAAALAGVMLASMIGCTGGSTTDPSASADPSTGDQGSTPVASEELKTAVDGKLVWATNAAFPPYEYYEGDQVVGIDADIIAAIAEKLGLEPQCEDMEFDSIIAAVQSGKADVGIAGMSITEDREQSVDFTMPYVNASQVVIVRFDSPIKTANEIAGKTVGVQLGTTGDLYVTENYSDTTVERYNKGFEAVEALLQKKIDAVVIDGDTAAEFVAANKEDDIVVLEESLTEEQYAIAVSKDNPDLYLAVSNALYELDQDGELDAIKKKYKGEEDSADTAAETAAEATTTAA